LKKHSNDLYIGWAGPETNMYIQCTIPETDLKATMWTLADGDWIIQISKGTEHDIAMSVWNEKAELMAARAIAQLTNVFSKVRRLDERDFVWKLKQLSKRISLPRERKRS
jgi:hypothetical protein